MFLLIIVSRLRNFSSFDCLRPAGIFYYGFLFEVESSFFSLATAVSFTIGIFGTFLIDSISFGFYNCYFYDYDDFSELISSIIIVLLSFSTFWISTLELSWFCFWAELLDIESPVKISIIFLVCLSDFSGVFG